MMIKGCERKMILVPGSDSSLYETAYFILKKDAEQRRIPRDDMLREANRIIERSIPAAALKWQRKEKRRRLMTSAALFFAGALAGGGVTAAICALLV